MRLAHITLYGYVRQSDWKEVIGQLTRQTTVEKIRPELTVAAAKGLSRHELMTA